MTPHPPAIVLGIDSPVGLAVMRDLGARGVPVQGVGKAGSIGRVSRYCTRFHERPPGPLAHWLPALIARSGAGALLAVGENDLVALAALPASIAGCRILTPRAAPLGLVLDKGRTLALAATLGLRVPSGWQPVAGEDFAARAARLRYPVVLKWADPVEVMPRLTDAGLAFVKAEFVADAGRLLAVLRRYAPLGHWPLVQGYCPGVGFGQMINMDAGAATLTFQHRRLHEWPPEGGVSTYCAAEPPERHGNQMARSIALLRAIGWQGPAMVEYRYDPATGEYWLMEVNGRFWGSLPLALHCGASFAWEQYRRTILGQTSPPPPPRSDLRARYMVPETRRLLRVLFTPSAITDPSFVRRPWAEAGAFLAGFVDPRTRYYLLSLRDPRPFLSDLFAVARKAWPADRPRPAPSPPSRSPAGTSSYRPGRG